MTAGTGDVRVSAADLVRQFGRWQQAAAARPLFVTHHGRDRFVLQSATSYAALVSAAKTGGDGDVLVDQLSEGYVAFDAGLRVTVLNPAAAAYLRLSRTETIGTRLFEEHLPLRRSLLFGHLVRALEAGAVAAFDVPSPAFPGRWLTVRLFPVRGGVGCLLRDVTESVVEQKELEMAGALRAAITGHGDVASAVVSPRGTLDRVDAALARMIGLPVDTLAQARLVDIVAINARVSVGEALEAVLTRVEMRALSVPLLTNQGREAPARISIAPIVQAGAAVGAVALFTSAA